MSSRRRRHGGDLNPDGAIYKLWRAYRDEGNYLGVPLAPEIPVNDTDGAAALLERRGHRLESRRRGEAGVTTAALYSPPRKWQAPPWPEPGPSRHSISTATSGLCRQTASWTCSCGPGVGDERTRC